jgi:thymidylate synthase
MEMIFKNTIHAYNNITFYLQSRGKKLNNYFCRSKNRPATMYECLGVSFKIYEIKDLDNLILKLERHDHEKFDKRMKWLKNLGEEFLNDSKIDSDKYYTYNNRIYSNKWYVLDNIVAKIGKNNRQAFLPIWNFKDNMVLGEEEVPCSIGYHFLERDGKLDMVYFMRSLDIDIWPNDVYLSDCVHKQMVERSGLKMGIKSWCIGSLHMFI